MDSLVSIFLLTCLLSISTAQTPGPVQNLVTDNIQQWGFTAAWGPPLVGNTPEFYNVTITNTNTNDVYERSLLPNADGSYEFDHLYDGTTYTFSVVAVNSDGQGGPAVEQTGIVIPNCQLCLSSANVGPSFLSLVFPATGVTTTFSARSVDASTEHSGSSRTLGPSLTVIFFLGLHGGVLYELQMTIPTTGALVYTSRYRTVPNPVTNLQLSPDSSTSVQVTYEQPIGTQYHKYDGFRITNGGQECFVGSSETAVVIDGLQAGMSYTIEVDTFSGELADRKYSTPAADDITLAPQLPGNVAVTEETTSTITLRWSPPSQGQFFGYILEYEGTGLSTELGRTPATSFLPRHQESITLKGLTPGTEYRIRISSYVEYDGMTTRSNTVTSLGNTMSTSSLNIVAKFVNQTSFSFEWQPVVGAQSYLTQVSEVTSGVQILSGTILNGNNERTVYGLVPGRNYQIEVSAVGEGQSDMVQQRMLPSAPSNVGVVPEAAALTLSWDPVFGDVDGYYASYQLKEDPYQISDLFYVSDLSNPMVRLTGLSPLREYIITVTSFSGSGSYQEISSSTVEASTVNYRPAEIVIETVTTTSIGLSWGASTSLTASSYVIEVSDAGNVVHRTSRAISQSRFIIITSLTPGTLYTIRITVTGSSEQDVETALTVPTAPRSLSVDSISQSIVTVSWSQGLGNVDEYDIYLRQAGESEMPAQIIPPSQLTQTFENLEPATDYSIRIVSVVRAQNLEQRSIPAVANFTTQPRIINVVETGRNLRLSWVSDFGNDILKYQLIYIEDEHRATSNSEFVDPSNAPSVTLMNLIPGQTYTLILTAVRTSGNRNQIASTTYTLKPLGPTFTVSVRSPSAASLLVNLFGGILNFFRMRVSPVVSGAGVGTPISIDVLIPVEACPEIELTGLIPNTEYRVSLQAESGVASSDPEIVTFTTPPLTQQGQLSFGEVTSSGFTVFWSPFNSLTSYDLSINQVQRVVPASGDAVQSYVVDGRTSGTTYTVSLVQGGTDTIRTRPLAPGSLTATQVLDTSIQLLWTPSADGSVTGYEICYSPEVGSGPSSYIMGRTTTQHTLGGLNSDTAYIISIAALTGSPQVKSQKQTIFVRTIADTTIPVASNFAVINTMAADHVIILGWDVPEGTSYDYFEVSYTPTVGYPASPVRLSKVATSLSIMNALADTVYQFSLVSVRGEERTDPPLMTTGQIVVNSVIVVIGERTTTSLEILWGQQQAVEQYEVSYDAGTRTFMVDRLSPRRVVIPGLSPGTEYTVTVQAINTGTPVGSSVQTASTLHEINGLSAMVTDQASSMIHLTITPPFEDPLRYDGYYVRVRLGGVSSPVVQPQIEVAQSACPEIWIKQLEAATMYDIDIEWYNGLDISEAFRVQTSTVAAAPLDITVDQLSTNFMRVSWQEGTGSFSNYLVTYSPGGSTPMLVARGEPRVLDLSGLVPGTAYTIMVQQQGQTPAQETHVQYTLPETINSLSVTASKNALDAAWSAPSTGNYDGYRVCHYPRGTLSSPYISGNSPSRNLPGLNSLTYYLVTVSSSVQSTYSEPYTTTQRTLIGDPGDINIALEDVDTTSVTITWVTVDTITTYTVGGGTQTSQAVSASTPEEATFTFTNLVPGTRYTFFVEPQGSQRREREQYTKPAMPRNLIISTVTMNSISITWERPLTGGVDSFRVTYSPSSDGSPMSPRTIPYNGDTQQTLTVTNLLPATTYTFNVYAVVTELVSEPVTRDTGTTIGMDIGPGYTSTQFTVLWDVPTAGTFNQFYVTYNLFDSTHPNAQEDLRIISLSSLNGAQQGYLLIYGLEPGELYNVYVETRLNGMQSNDGFGRISFRTPPLPVTDVVISQRTPYSLSLDWSDVLSTDIQYRITYAPQEGALFPNNQDSAKALPSNQVSESQIVAKSLAPGKEYVFTIYPVSGDPSSFEQVGEPQTVVTYTQPLSPQNLVVSDVGVEEVTLSWNLPAEVNRPIAYYEIDVLPNEPTFPIRINGTRDQWEIHDGLVSGREYQVVMRSVINDVNGQVIYSEPVQSAAFLLDPKQPQRLSTPYVTTSELRVEWTLQNSDFTTFQVSFSKDSATILTTDTSERSLLLTNLTVATVYDISIRTVVQGQLTNMIKTSAGALIMAVTTKSAPPQNLMQDEVTSDSITVSWGAPLNVVTMYHIIVKDEAGADVADATVPSSETGYTVENLNPYTKYIITVAARFNGLDSDAVEIEQTTFQGKPSEVRDPVVAIDSPNSVFLTWTPPASPNGILTGFVVDITGADITGRKKREAGFTRTETYGVTVFSALIENLPTGCSYTFSIKAANSADQSDAVIAGPLDLPHSAPPTPPSDRVVRLVSRTGTTMSVSFDSNIFSDVYGPVARYAILVAQSIQDTIPTTPSDPAISWQVGSGQPYQTTVLAYAPFTNGNTRALYTVGANGSCTQDSVGYCNGPVIPLTDYRFAIRAYGPNGKFTDNAWSPVYNSGIDSDWFVAAVVVIIIITLVLLLVMLLIYRQCCGEPTSSALYERGNGQRLPLVNAAYPSAHNQDSMHKAPLPEDAFRMSPIPVRENAYVSLGDDRPKAPIPANLPRSAPPLSNPVQMRKFPDHVNRMSAGNNTGFVEEYNSLSSVGRDKSTDASRLPVNATKNRYRNILPFDETAVHLQDLEEGQTSDYINANYIQGLHSMKEYIASQGPVPDSVNDFWEMVFENKSTTIAMITGLVEGGKTKCEHYWPDDDIPVNYGSVTVTMTHTQEMEQWTVRSFLLEKGMQQFETRQYAFKGWVDHDVPNNARPMIEFIRTIDVAHDANLGPIVVHCSAGIGRTGVFIALHKLIKQVETSKPNDYIDVCGTVARMREQRFNMVQTVKQYIFIHQCLLPLMR